MREVKFPHKNGAFLYCAQYGDLDTVLAGGSGTDSVEIIESSTNRVSSLNPVLPPIPRPRPPPTHYHPHPSCLCNGWL